MPEDNATKIKFEIKEKGICGIIYLKDEIIYAVWYEYESEDLHRILQAMGAALGYPVILDTHESGNGHYFATLRKAADKEAALQAKIAQCQSLEYLLLPPYKRLDEMKKELGDAILNDYADEPPSDFRQWIVDTSKTDIEIFLERWVRQALNDGIEAAKAGNWQEADNASSLAFYHAKGDNEPEAEALFFITTEQTGQLADSCIIICCRSFSAEFAQKIQKHLNNFCEIFGLSPDMFNIKTVIRNHFSEYPQRAGFDDNLAKILEDKD